MSSETAPDFTNHARGCLIISSPSFLYVVNLIAAENVPENEQKTEANFSDILSASIDFLNYVFSITDTYIWLTLVKF